LNYISSKTKSDKNSSKISQNRILIVDDDADIALTFKNGLENNGFQVEAFISARELLSQFKPDYYSLLLIDIRMEEMSGFELYKRIREKDKKPRVCFITSFLNYYESLIENYPEIELTCLIAKPITIENLITRIKAELGTDSDNN
jgi:DNA-binding response OmpR family regulator